MPHINASLDLVMHEPCVCGNRLLSSWMDVNHYEENPRSGIMVDFFLYNLIYCKDEGFTMEQTSAFFSIMKAVFDHSLKDEVR